MRLHELDPVVDKFVLVESSRTQTGTPKPFYFDIAQTRFSKFRDKIIHIKLDEDSSKLSNWEREHWQRNQILRGLSSCTDDDIIIISDLDEIPKRNVLNKTIQSCDIDQPHVLMLKMHFFHLNRSKENECDWENKPWYGSSIVKFSLLKKKTPQYIRDERKNSFIKISNAGWHFSWMGGINKMREKAASVVEGIYYNDVLKNDESVLNWINSACPKITPVDKDSDFPEFMITNLETLKQKGLIAE